MQEFKIDNGVLIRYLGAKENVVIPEGITTIGENAFWGKGLTSVVIPSSVTSIESCAFENNRLARVTIPDSVTSIGDSAFAGNLLMNVTIPDSVTFMGACAFANNSLINVEIGKGLSFLNIKKIFFGSFIETLKIGLNAGGHINIWGLDFVTKLQIKHLRLGPSVIEIGLDAFSNCQLESVIIPNSVIEIDPGAFEENQLTRVTIPDSVTRIGASAFQNNQLTSVTIPDSVTSIESNAFEENQLTSITIPHSVESISGTSFWNNPLTEITISKEQVDNLPKLILGEDHKSITILGQLSFRERFELKKKYPNCKIYFKRALETGKLQNKEENRIDDKIHDDEIEQLVTRIRTTIEPMEDDIEQSIHVQVNNILKQYKEQIHKLEPSLSLESTLTLDSTPTFEMVRNNAIAKLQRIISSLSYQESLVSFLNDIQLYQDLQDQEFDIPKSLENIEDKVCYIIAVASKYKSQTIKGKLKFLLEHINNMISERLKVSIQDKIELSLENEMNIKRIFETSLDEQLTDVKQYHYIRTTLDELEEIMQEKSKLLDDRNKEELQTQLDSIKVKFDFDFCSNQEFKNLLQMINNDLQPLLEQVNMDRSMLEILKDINDKGGNGLIQSLKNEILTSIDLPNIPAEIQTQVKRKLDMILTHWQTQLASQDKVQIKSKVFQQFDYNIQVQLEIAKQLSALKFDVEEYIQKKLEYEKQKEEHDKQSKQA